MPEPAGLAGTATKHKSQEDTGTYDDHVTGSGWEQPGAHHKAKPQEPGKDRPQPLRSGMGADVRAQSPAKLSFA
jgi:hypothetical protein